MNETARYLVKDLLIEPGRGRVMRGDKEIPLPKLSFDLLLALTRAAPDLLSVDALIEKVWPGLVVSPETVCQRIKLLRHALGDDSKAPRYIAGLRGRGYKIVTPVEIIPIDPQQEVAKPSASRSNSPGEPNSGVVGAARAAIYGPSSSAARGGRVGIKASGAVLFAVLALALGAYFTQSWLETKEQEAPATRRAVTVTGTLRPPPQSVAVLPFMNLSGDAREDYFVDGLSEELVHALARLEDLRVAARTSSFAFRGSAIDIPTIGRKLNVGAILEGSVRKSGSRVRITAQLVDTRNGFHLWSQTYERESKDTLALQTEIAAAVAATLQIALAGNAKRMLGVGGTSNARAFDAYLRGRYGESIQDEAGLRSALVALDEAIKLDPAYANAHAFRANVLAQLANMWTQDAKEREQLNRGALASAEKAVAMAPQSGLAHSVLGSVLATTSTDYGRIDQEYRRSIELEPGNASLLKGYASYAAHFGRPDALAAAKRAVSLDPLGPATYANLGVTLFYARRHDEARAAFQQAAKLGDNLLTTHWAGMNELAAGRPRTALPYCERDPNFSYNQICLAMAYHRLKRRKEAAALLERLQREHGDSAAYQYAQIHAYWGRPQEALAWLSKAVELKDGDLLALKTDPFLDPVRNAPELQDIIRKLNLPS